MARTSKRASHEQAAEGSHREEGWGVEKRIRIEFIVYMAVTIGGFAWYAADAAALLRAVNDRVTKLEISVAADAAQHAAVGDRITRIEGKQELTVEILNRVERQLGDIKRGQK